MAAPAEAGALHTLSRSPTFSRLSRARSDRLVGRPVEPRLQDADRRDLVDDGAPGAGASLAAAGTELALGQDRRQPLNGPS